MLILVTRLAGRHCGRLVTAPICNWLIVLTENKKQNAVFITIASIYETQLYHYLFGFNVWSFLCCWWIRILAILGCIWDFGPKYAFWVGNNNLDYDHLMCGLWSLSFVLIKFHVYVKFHCFYKRNSNHTKVMLFPTFQEHPPSWLI